MGNYPFTKASIRHRLGGKALDLALNFVTFGIGWSIWSLVVWGQGQTPAKQILRMRVYDKTTEKPAKWGQMAIREFLLPLAFVTAIIPLAIISAFIPLGEIYFAIMGVLYIGAFAIQLVDAFWILRKDERNRLVDVFAKTDVLNESE